MKIQQELELPSVSEFITVKSKPSQKQEGFQKKNEISIKDLTDVEAENYAEEMKQNFLNFRKELLLKN